MTYDVMCKRPQVDLAVVEALGEYGSATVHEVMHRRGALDSVIKPIRFGMKVCGPALTVWAEPGDNLIVHKALSMAEAGDVLVVCTRTPEAGFWGEVMTTAALGRGVNGLVTDGAVRDSEPISKRGFPVFSANLCIKGTLKRMPGRINHPMVMAGQWIHPGDIVLGDDDGVVVIPWQEADGVLEGARARERKEAAFMERLLRGESTMDLLGLNEAYQSLGLSEEPPL